MPDFPPRGYRLMIVDDDTLTREVLTLLAEDAGFDVQACESGVAALQALGVPGAKPPQGVLADLQMPEPSGDTLARLLRAACGEQTTLIAISGTAVPAQSIRAYDSFLLKPFSIADLCAVLDRAAAVVAREAPIPAGNVDALNAGTYEAISQSMPREQVRQLYAMCLDDAEARIEIMREAAARLDEDAYRRAAHSIKGGCGMVGASELACLAAEMERQGIPENEGQLPFREFLAASVRLKRTLAARFP